LDALALIGTVVLAGRKCQFQREKTVIRGFIPYQGELRVKLTYFATRTNFMAKIGLFFGTQTGKTETVAEMIQKEFGGEAIVELHDISSASTEDFAPYDALIIGCPTWNIGELQSDWEGFYDELDDIDFASKKVAYFGMGDQIGYADNFQDALGILEEKIASLGGKTVGYWPTDGYDFNESKALKNGKFVGLALDEDNQSDLTEQRIKTWVAGLKGEFGV
jgi:flavodoxin I